MGKPLPTILLLRESVSVHIDRKERGEDSPSQRLSPIMNLHPTHGAILLVVCPARPELKALPQDIAPPVRPFSYQKGVPAYNLFPPPYTNVPASPSLFETFLLCSVPPSSLRGLQ